MNQLFAPWRIEWVEREGDGEGCPFCRLPSEARDREHLLVARGDHAFVLLNNAPYNPGHVMVIPYAHTGDLRSLDDGTLLECARLRNRTIDAIETAFSPDGFNVGLNLGDAAGGSIDDHVHTHVVPRWHGDTNFMAVIDDTTVIVEGLADSYERLHEAFAAQEGTTVTGADDAIRIE